MTQKKEFGKYMKAIAAIKMRGYEKVKAQIKRNKKPKPLRIKTSNVVVPQISAELNGEETYFEILDQDKDLSKNVPKWKEIERVTRKDDTSFKLILSHKDLSFAHNIISDYNIKVELMPLEDL